MTQSIFLHTHTHTHIIRYTIIESQFEHNDRSRNFTISQEQGLCRYFLLGGYAPALRN